MHFHCIIEIAMRIVLFSWCPYPNFLLWEEPGSLVFMFCFSSCFVCGGGGGRGMFQEGGGGGGKRRV